MFFVNTSYASVEITHYFVTELSIGNSNDSCVESIPLSYNKYSVFFCSVLVVSEFVIQKHIICSDVNLVSFIISRKPYGIRVYIIK